MLFDPQKMLQTPHELIKLEGALDEYLALDGDALARMRFKRRGPARQAMLEAVAQMAMLFAAANMGTAPEFDACLKHVVADTLRDDAPRRALRGFYLRNITRVPGTVDDALLRLLQARPVIMDGPLTDSGSTIPA